MDRPPKVWSRHPLGRPAVVAFRLPEVEREELDAEVLRTGLTASEVIRKALNVAGVIGRGRP